MNRQTNERIDSCLLIFDICWLVYEQTDKWKDRFLFAKLWHLLTCVSQEPHPKRMSFDEAVAKANKSGRPMSIFYFLSNLKPYFVEVLTFVGPVALESFHFSHPNYFEVFIIVPVSVRLAFAVIFCNINCHSFFLVLFFFFFFAISYYYYFLY